MFPILLHLTDFTPAEAVMVAEPLPIAADTVTESPHCCERCAGVSNEALEIGAAVWADLLQTARRTLAGRLTSALVDRVEQATDPDPLAPLLTKSERRLFRALALSPGDLVASEHLCELLDTTASALKVHVARLRAKLAGRYVILSVRSLGYVMERKEPTQ